MKHIHGIEVRLLDDKGRLVAEGAPSKQTESSLLRFNGQVGSRNVCLKTGKRFKVHVKIHRDFKFYAAEGVKIVIVADGVYPGDERKTVRQRYGLWWIDETDRQNEFVIEGFTVWNERRASHEEYTNFLSPEVDDNPETATTNWITQEHYCANEGSIAVFVERGSLVEEDEEAGISLGTRLSMPSPIPIRYDEFLSLNSNNAFPYVFEFRNSKDIAPNSACKNDTFGGNCDKVDADSDKIVYDTDAELSEDDADVTDGSDSESACDSEVESDILSDTDMDSVASEDSYDTSPRPRRRKRKARSPIEKPQRKRAKTNAEKNAEADAGNATFASLRNKKNQDTDATNPSLMNLRPDLDRDDEEQDLPWIKKEPNIKQERCASRGGVMLQKSSAKASTSKRDSRPHIPRRSIVDLTLDDSEDGEEDPVKRGTRDLRKKLDNMAKNMDAIKSSFAWRS